MAENVASLSAYAMPKGTVRRRAWRGLSHMPQGNVQELMAADAEDESLRKYKESLLGAAAKGDLGDVRQWPLRRSQPGRRSTTRGSSSLPNSASCLTARPPISSSAWTTRPA